MLYYIEYLNIIVLYDTYSSSVYDGVLYPVVVLGVVFVCTGGGILGTIHLAILSERGGVISLVIELVIVSSMNRLFYSYFTTPYLMYWNKLAVR